jgi:hypothetical protein
MRAIHLSTSYLMLCSHICTTFQPCFLRARPSRRSRALLASSFGSQYERLDFGRVPWIGHPCQKQPCTSTTSRASGKTKSGRITRPSSLTGRCRLQPVTPLLRNAFAKGTSVDRFPLDRTLAINRERCSLVSFAKASPSEPPTSYKWRSRPFLSGRYIECLLHTCGQEAVLFGQPPSLGRSQDGILHQEATRTEHPGRIGRGQHAWGTGPWSRKPFIAVAEHLGTKDVPRPRYDDRLVPAKPFGRRDPSSFC